MWKKSNNFIILASLAIIVIIFSVFVYQAKLTPFGSTKIESIEKDLKSIDLTDVDKEIEDVGKELNY